MRRRRRPTKVPEQPVDVPWTLVPRCLDIAEVDGEDGQPRRRVDCCRYDLCLEEVDALVRPRRGVDVQTTSWVCDGCEVYEPRPVEELREEAAGIAVALAKTRAIFFL